MQIRKAGTKDAQTISLIHALSWKSAYKGILPQGYLDNLKDDFWTVAFEQWISEESLTVQMMFDNDEVVGSVGYRESKDEGMLNWGEIVSLYLVPKYFGKGYGEKLLEKAMSEMKSMGLKNVHLWVLEKNNQGQNFYTKNGFSKNGDHISVEIAGIEVLNLRFIYFSD